MFTWYIPDGFVPDTPNPTDDVVIGHEAVAVMNCADTDAAVTVDVYFAKREPILNLRYVIPARRSWRLIAGAQYAVDFGDKLPIPTNEPYSLRLTSESDLHLQFTRIDSRSARMAMFSTGVARETV